MVLIKQYFRFSWKISLLSVVLAAGCVRLSIWQWHRHQEKLTIIENLNHRLREPVTPIQTLVSSALSPESISYRRVSIEGTFDFQYEMVLRNRKLNGQPGVFALTPLRIKNSNVAVLVNRGFIPLMRSDRVNRQRYATESEISFIGLIKEPVPTRAFQIEEPETGQSLPWVDAWLRVDINKMQKQIPYPLLPFWVEIMGKTDAETAAAQIVVSNSGRDDLMNLASRGSIPTASGIDETLSYPIPSFDLVIPPARHLGYVFEWLWIGLGIIVIGFLAQVDRRVLLQTKSPSS